MEIQATILIYKYISMKLSSQIPSTYNYFDAKFITNCEFMHFCHAYERYEHYGKWNTLKTLFYSEYA